MDKETLTAQELLNACILKYSLVNDYFVNFYNFKSLLEFRGYIAKIDVYNNFFLVKDFKHSYSSHEVFCVGWSRYTTLKDAYKHLDYLLNKLSNFEQNYKKYLVSKRLKKIKNDF